MKTKLHFGVLVILLAFLGTYIDQMTVPNQQIVIQFSNKDFAKADAEHTIAIVKKQLQNIGVTHIEISHNDDGQLKITYYSNSDVKRIQQILSKEDNFKFAFNSEDQKSSTNFPKHKTVKDFELNISEIQNSNDYHWDFERTEVVKLNQKSEHSYNPKVTASGNHINLQLSNQTLNVAIQIYNADVLAIEHKSYQIPQVRAGPHSIGII